MPFRTVNVLEKDLYNLPTPPVALVANTPKDVLANSQTTSDEIVSIQLFNAGANPAYYAYGRDCDAVGNYNAFLAAGQMLDVQTRERVSMMSVAGTTISITIIRRRDMVQHGNVLQA